MTTAIWRRSTSKGNVRMSCPPIKIRPCWGSKKRGNSQISVDFPAPLDTTRLSHYPGSTESEMAFKTWERVGYPKLTVSNSMTGVNDCTARRDTVDSDGSCTA